MSISAWNVKRKLRSSPIKTPPLRLPGQSIEERISELHSEWFDHLVLPLCLVALAMVAWWQRWFSVLLNPWALTILAVISSIYTWQKAAPLLKTVKNLRLGRDGERVVGQMLEPLRGKGYRVFHDIPGADFNIDHAIVGPAGIFTIETKTKTKPMDGSHKILYDGHAIRLEDGRSFQQPLIQARAQAHGLANFLNDGRTKTFTVRPVVVFPEWYVETIGPRNKNDVWVLNPKQLASWLDQEPRVLSTDAIDAASHALTQYCRRPITEESED